MLLRIFLVKIHQETWLMTTPVCSNGTVHIPREMRTVSPAFVTSEEEVTRLRSIRIEWLR